MERERSIGYRPTWAEVNLNALTYNYRQVKRLVAANTKILVCVKSDAYGHGIIPVSKKLVSLGVDYLGVASIDEGILLRKAGIKSPILVLGMVLPSQVNPLLKFNLTQTVCSPGLARALNRQAKAERKIANIHIKVDTGMGRLGVWHTQAFDFIEKTSRLKSLNIEGVFTHFPCADINSRLTNNQINIFNKLIARLNEHNIRIPFFHAANSIGLINYKKSRFNLVRPGLVIYGLRPCRNIPIKLKPVLSLTTKVVYLKKVPKGTGLSYGHIYRTKKSTTIATLPIGYGDGYPRNLSGQADVLIKKRRFKIRARICMDQTLVDVGNAAITIGDRVVLIGSEGKSKITVEELARISQTIPYEIVCSLGNRIPRVYKD